jgi:hypothetical protein
MYKITRNSSQVRLAQVSQILTKQSPISLEASKAPHKSPIAFHSQEHGYIHGLVFVARFAFKMP